MMVPSERMLPSDQVKPLLPTTFPLYEARFRDQPNIFYYGTMSANTIDHIEAFWRREFPGIYPALAHGNLLEKGSLNIARHNIMAGMYAHDLSLLIGLDSQKVAIAAGIHDFGKLRENQLLQYAMQEPNEQRAILKALQTSKNDDRQALALLGYSSEIIELSGANVPKKPDKIRNHRRIPPSVNLMAQAIVEGMSDEERIIWIMDAMLVDTQPSEIETRFNVTRAEAHKSPTEREFRNQAVHEALSRYYDVDYHELQLEIGTRIERALIERIIEHNPEYKYLKGGNMMLPFFLQRRLIQQAEVAAKATPIPW